MGKKPDDDSYPFRCIVCGGKVKEKNVISQEVKDGSPYDYYPKKIEVIYYCDMRISITLGYSDDWEIKHDCGNYRKIAEEKLKHFVNTFRQRCDAGELQRQEKLEEEIDRLLRGWRGMD